MFVRSDLPLVDQLVQVGHACLEAGWRFPMPPEQCYLVLLAVPSREGLLDALERLTLAGIAYSLFVEPDDDMGPTAACTAPVRGSARQHFRRYRLWRSEHGRPPARGPPT